MSHAIEPNYESHEPKLTDHNYDGIQEYDNPMPGWWVWLFVATAVFSLVYWLYFETGVEGRSIFDEYGRHQASVMTVKFGEIGELQPDAATILTYMQDPKWLAVGKATYNANCVSCHGIDGGGGIGPNLTDNHWKGVRSIEDIANVIKNGAANGAMPAWGSRFNHPNVLVLTSAYVASLRGSSPGNPKAPEGVVVEPWPAAPAAPATPATPEAENP
jgi:cytochrome c oxidase cbb3-type subunit 3